MSGPADLLDLDRALTLRDAEDDERAAEQRRRGPRAWWRRNRWLVGLVVLLVLASLVTLLQGGSSGGPPLDPDSTAPDGARAVVRVLEEQGVDVRPGDDLATVLAEAGPGQTVLVLDAGVLRPQNLRELRGTGADLVLVEPSLPVLQVLAPELALGGVGADQLLDPGCEDPDARAAGEALAGGSRYVAADGSTVPGVEGEPRAAGAEVSVCYPTGSGARPDAGSYAVVDDGQRRVVVHGQPAVLTNERLASAGNAALALRSLGRQPVLHWYRASPLDPALADDGGTRPPEQLLPAWVRWVGVQLLVVLVVAVVWRARRLGRLVPERLPAVVRSVETAEGRARLYRSASARGTSAHVLRHAATRRLAVRLGASAAADPASVARLAAAASGRPATDVEQLLLGPEPPDDAALVRLADELDTLEREVTRR